jgi:photosystem II stability/assembly factor-like uncharacterized protein
MRTAPLVIFSILLSTAPAQTLDPSALNELEWRSIGPGSIGGRVSAIAGVPGNPRIVYVATGSGGLFKTANAGVTWEPMFDRPETISIGDVAIDPKNPDTVWVGTGEANVRNSVSFGSGMYYSADGGKTWRHRGLDRTMTIARIALDPRDARRVFVAALGHPFGPNPERGVFFSPDAGATWQKVLYIDDRHGASDLAIDPANPDVIFAGMWRFDRKPWRYDSGDTGGGLFKSADGGKTWRKITSGLPALMGRIGVKVAPGNPKVVYVIAETRQGVLFRSDDGGESFHAVSNDRGLVRRGYYFCDLRVDPKNDNRVYVLEGGLMVSDDGGATFARIGDSVHGDLQALWIDPLDPGRMWQGSDGGIAHSWDAGHTWEHIASISLGQFYHVYADNREPFYQVSGGTQDNGTWTGPSRTREPAGILNRDWRMVSPIVGFNVLSDADDPDILLSEMPGGALLRTDLRTRDQQDVSPQVRNYGGATAARMKYRFAWDAPLLRSPFGKHTFYYAANVIFQTSDNGRSWEPISHDLTSADTSKMQPSGGPVFIDNSSSETYGAITALSESPARRGVLWAGADDGNVQVSFNGGDQWTNVAPNIHGIAPGSPVSAIETSHRDPNTAYVGFDRHMLDDMQPYLFKTTDGGKTWARITDGLPMYAVVWAVREDPKNADVLYAGTEVGLFVSFDAGAHWARFGLKNLPNVAVRDVIVQPAQGDILIATHGRGLWILDDATPVEQLAQASKQTAYLFPVRPALRSAVRATQAAGGDTEFRAPNPPYGAILDYYLRKPVDQVRFEILDAAGKTIRRIGGPRIARTAGVHRIAWDLRAASPGGEVRGRALRGPQVLPGIYTVRMTAGGLTAERKVEVTLDPELKVGPDDLKAQWDALESLSEMIQGAAGMLRAAAAHPDSPEWTQFRDTLVRPRGLSASETGPRLSEQLQSLYTLIDGPNDAPTHAMMELLAQLQDDYRKAGAALRALGP